MDIEIGNNNDDNNDDNKKKIKKNKKQQQNIKKDQTIKEIDYCSLINHKLPDNIRVVGWTEVTDGFSSRFSATSRTYRYFFVKGKKNVNNMNIAASYIVGDHDFRNLCKIDIANVSNFRREIYSAKIIPFQVNNDEPERSVW
jgi:tRNA pseudouridine(38-40) synthase